MNLKASNHSHYPKIGETDAQHRLRRAYHALDQKKINASELKKVLRETTEEAIREQEDFKLDIVTDGGMGWSDPVSHLMKHLEGVEIGGLLRWFDTNFYFRQPTVVGPIFRKSSLLKEDGAFLKRVSKKETKAVLTGPYTLSLLSKIQTPAYSTKEAVGEVLTQILAEEVMELAQIGVDHIQIDEPGFVLEEPSWKWVEHVFDVLSEKKGKSKLWLSIYFGDVVPLYSKLQALSVDVLSLDCTYSPTLLKHIEKTGSEKELALGLLDGRNTKLEKLNDVVKSLKTLSKSLKSENLYVTLSSGLEYLPRDRAVRKLNLLGQIKEQWK